jgi:hypothetical protein
MASGYSETFLSHVVEVLDFGAVWIFRPMPTFRKNLVSMFRDLSEEGDSMFLRNVGIDQQIHKHQNQKLRHMIIITVRISNLI